MNICIFEDDKAVNFYPLSLTRPVYDLKCGIFSLSEKIINKLPQADYYFHCRGYLQPSQKIIKRKILTKNKLYKLDSVIFINGRVLLDNSFTKKLLSQKVDKLFYHKDTLIAAFITKNNFPNIKLNSRFEISTKKSKKTKITQKTVNFLWDIIELNEKEIISDAKLKFNLGKISGKLYENVTLINKEEIFVAPGASVKSGTVLDAEAGPIIIDKNSKIAPNCTIAGPVYIGLGVRINPGAKILGGTSIGEASKIGGEVAESIIHSYSNKQHNGFLGHSYIGSWCNLGAGTNNSDLKNNYSSVEVIINGKKINTALQFIGMFMGDHSKSGINTMFNTGSVVGTATNVFGSGYLPKFIPSFTWFDSVDGVKKYDFQKFIKTASAVYRRRSIKFSQTDKNIFSFIDKLSSKNKFL